MGTEKPVGRLNNQVWEWSQQVCRHVELQETESKMTSRVWAIMKVVEMTAGAGLGGEQGDQELDFERAEGERCVRF